MVITTGLAKIQDNLTIAEVPFATAHPGATAWGGYTFSLTQNRWYWSCGPEAWTVYDATTQKYTYYPQGWTTVYSDTWVIHNSITGNNAFLGRFPSEPVVPSLGPNETVIADPNRGQTVGSLEFYGNHTYVSPNDYPIAGVYHNFNNPVGGMLHYFNTNKVYLGKTKPTANAEPNGSGATPEYCLQFAYPSTGAPALTQANNLDEQGLLGATYSFPHPGKPDTWNDYNAVNTNSLYGYFVEYGGYLDDPKIDELGGSDVTSTSEVELVLPVIIQYRSTEKNVLNNFQIITSIGTGYDRMLNYEQHLPYTA
jgi:hypothetical protein